MRGSGRHRLFHFGPTPSASAKAPHIGPGIPVRLSCITRPPGRERPLRRGCGVEYLARWKPGGNCHGHTNAGWTPRKRLDRRGGNPPARGAREGGPVLFPTCLESAPAPLRGAREMRGKNSARRRWRPVIEAVRGDSDRSGLGSRGTCVTSSRDARLARRASGAGCGGKLEPARRDSFGDRRKKVRAGRRGPQGPG